jgi:DNA-binding response OmpR family regulator
MRVLLAEDNNILGKSISRYLSRDGYAVDWFDNGDDAASALGNGVYDVAVLDVGLPGRSGLEVLHSMRSAGLDIPVLMLTARDALSDRIAGLDHGADDYVCKPCDLEELSARMRALLRRGNKLSAPVLRLGALELDLATHSATLAGEPLELSRRELSLLHVLIENAGKVVTRSRLENSLYSWNEEIDSNALEVHIHRLRKKLGPRFIKTIRGVGYIMVNPE